DHRGRGPGGAARGRARAGARAAARAAGPGPRRFDERVPAVGERGAVVAGLVLGADEPQPTDAGTAQPLQPMGDLPVAGPAHRPAGRAPRNRASWSASPFAAAWIRPNASATSSAVPP